MEWTLTTWNTPKRNMELPPQPTTMAALAGDSGFLHIVAFLGSVVDVYNLFSCCKKFCFCTLSEKAARIDVLRKMFLRNLARGLAPFGLPLEQFLAALRADKVSISGGFALAVVTGKFPPPPTPPREGERRRPLRRGR